MRRKLRGNWGRGQERGRSDRWKNKAKDDLMVNTIGTEPNAPIVYAPGSEHHHLTMSKIGRHGYRLDIEIDTYIR